MAEFKGGKLLTNKQKEELLVEKYYRENFENAEQIGKVNLDRNEVVTNMKTASQLDYTFVLREKKVKSLSTTTINLTKGQKALKLVAYCSTNYFDLDNPQKGRFNGKYSEALRNDLKTNDSSIKTIAVFGGDLLGTEWTMAHLKKARIHNGTALYWGLNKRKERLLYDIKLALSCGAEVYLMQGAQEHKIYKETGRDIFKEISLELNNPNVKYIDEGTAVICNLVSHNGKATHNTIALLTNMIGKAQDSKADYLAGLRSNGTLSSDATFVFNGNSAGKYGPNYYHVSGQSLFKKTPKGKKPQFAPKGYNVFTIYPEGEHELSIVEGSPENFVSNNLELEKKLHEEQRTREILSTIVKEKLDEKIDKFIN